MSWLVPRQIKVGAGENRYTLEFWHQLEGTLVQCGFTVTEPQPGKIIVDPDAEFLDAMADESPLFSTAIMKAIRHFHVIRHHFQGPPHASNRVRGSRQSSRVPSNRELARP